MKWISAATVLVALVSSMTANQACAQQGSGGQSLDDIRARLEQQDRQIQVLQAQLASQQSGVHALPAGFDPSGGTAAAPAPPQSPPPYVIGSDLSVQTSFKNGSFLFFETPNRDFSMHLGGWVQNDYVWWNQAANLKAAQGQTITSGANSKTFGAGNNGIPGVASGAAPGGVGDLQDGDSWRRIRLVMEGICWETYEYRFNVALENIQFGTTGLDEFFVGQRNLPVVGTIRVGHVKTAMGLEADMTASSRCMTFMERSSYSEAIELNQNLATGLWLSNSYLDDRTEWQFAVFRPDNANSGDSFGDGQFGVQGRITALPFYEDEGRHLVHVGLSSGWRNGSGTIGNNSVTLQARSELRDDDPAAQSIQPITNSNDARMVSTGPLLCTDEYLMGLEFLYIRGPLSLQAEYGWNWLYGAHAAAAGSGTNIGATAPANYVFDGGYVQIAYTLTGENRGYDKKLGSFSRHCFGNQGPYENAFLIRDEDGNLIGGRGAWEVALRYSHIDLNSGAGATRVQGGIMDGFGLGLNWYLNTNLTVNMEWVYDNRYDLPGAGTTPPYPGSANVAASIPGSTSGFGTRVQFSF